MSGVGSFIQLIDVTTDHPDEVQRRVDEWLRATEGRRTVLSATICADRSGGGRRYVHIVEFPTADDARVNGELPETGALAQTLEAFCERIDYVDLDVRVCLRT